VKVVVASMNADKLRELGELLDLPGLELVSLSDIPGARSPEENGATLLDNARIKARAASAFTRLPAIADDTGLEVDALGGRPGINAARYAGPGATYADNVQKLLRELDGIPIIRRTARFRSVCVMHFPTGKERIGEGVLEGRIVEAPRGEQGFGYDPVFEVTDRRRTLAEMSRTEKNRLSHRARATRALRASLLLLLTEDL
jgi:XTP/dITP diphosphohydrolase